MGPRKEKRSFGRAAWEDIAKPTFFKKQPDVIDPELGGLDKTVDYKSMYTSAKSRKIKSSYYNKEEEEETEEAIRWSCTKQYCYYVFIFSLCHMIILPVLYMILVIVDALIWW